jgi:recombinational DNA repair protein RecT
VAASKQLAKCDKFSIYSAFTELAISGGTLRDGLCYILPFGEKATFMPGWKYRLEQVNELPNVVHCHEPVVVYDCDEFDYERGMKTIIKVHRPGIRTEANAPIYVYWVIEFKHGPDVYIMSAMEVLKIRDTYSKSYKDYVAAANAAGVKPDGKTKVMKNGQYGPYEVELPMWIKDEGEAFKKTIVRRTWKHLPKLPKQKWLESRLKEAGIPEDTDPEEQLSEGDFDKMLLKEEGPEMKQGSGNSGPEDLAFEDVSYKPNDIEYSF